MKTRVVHCRKEPYDVMIDRTTKWGNPFPVSQYGREGALRRYRYWLPQQKELMDSLHELEGKILGCWCKDPADPKDCHGDFLVELIEGDKMWGCAYCNCSNKEEDRVCINCEKAKKVGAPFTFSG